MYIHFLEILLLRVHITNIATTTSTTILLTPQSYLVPILLLNHETRVSCSFLLLFFFTVTFDMVLLTFYGIGELRLILSSSFLRSNATAIYILCIVVIAYVFIIIIISVNKTVLLTQIMIHYENSHFLDPLTFLVDRPVDK